MESAESVREELFRQNPWWFDAGSISGDAQLKRFYSNPIKWDARVGGDGAEILVLRGPRQVGKSTLVKRRIEQLLSVEKVLPQSVCFFSCDLISSKDELYSFCREFLDFSGQFKPKNRRVFIDEASFVRDWPLAIKRLKDAGELEGVRLFLTGSNSSDLKRGAERLAGRGIEGNEYFLYPLSFGECLSAFGEHVEPVAKSPFHLFGGKTVSTKAFASLRKIEPFFAVRGKAFFGKFLETGGFLKAINERERGEIPQEETYLRWIERDLSALGKDLHSSRQVLRAAIEKKCAPASMLSIAKQTDIASHNTVKEYVSALEELQVLSLYPCFDASKKQVVMRKDKKIHFLDPFIAKALCNWTNARLPEACVVEGVVAEHMRRLAMQNGFSTGYYKDASCEVDVVLEKNGQLLPIEVKWQEKIAQSDLQGLYKFGYGILATKNTLAVQKERYLLIPVPMLLAAFKTNSLQKLRYSFK